MCLRTIKNMSLERQLSRCEQELKSIKASQNYGMSGVKSYNSPEITFNSESYYDPYTEVTNQRIVKDLIFVGQYPAKVAIGVLKLSRYLDLGFQTNQFFYYATNSPNEIRIRYECYGGSDSFSETMYFEANMPGVLREQ